MVRPNLIRLWIMHYGLLPTNIQS